MIVLSLKMLGIFIEKPQNYEFGLTKPQFKNNNQLNIKLWSKGQISNIMPVCSCASEVIKRGENYSNLLK